MDHVAVFGIGSTNFRYTVAEADGTFQAPVSVEPTRPRELSAQLVAAVEELGDVWPLDAVGISCTGLVDASTGGILDLDTPAGETVDRVDIAGPVEAAHGSPVTLVNDCNAAALGEWRYGMGRDEDCVAHVTFGTGVGGGVVEGGRLVRGESGRAGEFGLLPVVPHRFTSTGVAGAWEAVCSGRGIPRFVASRCDQGTFADAATFDAEDVFGAAASGDEFAADCLDEVARYNAAGIGAVCNAVNPGLVTLGGGVALNNPDWIVDGIERHVDEYLFVDRPTIECSPLGDDVGLYGALAASVAQSDPAVDDTEPSPPGAETD